MKLNYLNLTSGRGRVVNVALFELKKKKKKGKKWPTNGSIQPV